MNKISPNKSVLIMAGGTGGHVFPALAIALALQREGVSVSWLGTQYGISLLPVKEAGFPLEVIASTSLYGKPLLEICKSLFVLAYACIQAFFILWRRHPSLVLGMGGYVSGPGGLAASVLRIPLVIHEQNILAGLTNRCLAPFAVRILEGFPGTFHVFEKTAWTGNPVRSDIEQLGFSPVTFRNKHSLAVGKTHDTLRLLVLGGSQGAECLNYTVPEALKLLPPSIKPSVWHQTGKNKFHGTEERYHRTAQEGRLEPFIENMASAYEWATLVLARAGALTLTELMAAGRGAILVPYPHAADDHQTYNARYFVRLGAGLLVEQSTLTPWRLAELLRYFHTHPERLFAMGIAGRRGFRTLATRRVVRECLAVLNGGCS
ncbi:MAG: undecaprenyldiphospho-muramoylpentapeptide beta-N-acetylglucosaminyltransferase [Gammaproteobacteria bacterium]|nr:undecaprenyldiphospho-muramoylpentapeptide beta-N-acetylglucosaminyltransferase [Gammaproteobacteria bacterium]